MRRLGNTFPCPVCGEEVPNGAKSCPECGACDKSGWSGHAYASDLGLPDRDFDYEKFVADEFGGGRKKTSWQWVWWVVALVLFIVLLWGFSQMEPSGH